MSKISKETVEHVAGLANLKFSPIELKKYTEKFASVLHYVEKLDKLDTKGVEPTSHAIANVSMTLREDKAVDFKTADDILKDAPAKEGRLIEVPKVIEES
ncbi:MAG: Asp-tRNA(Asn)/Glu-tRNA(Gln) amidotransferase GatCAB subunit C [Deltaproteobacteria bacterium CG11_big_fil_rev_8_21_14_0_20_49_13]|nr:MAG: Asp-tRNA(Asn)/Glu-tRNA(Gln) amidotransferase GatCAB subunit C [Deltaproteobacteria bacterium CG11_big_fil_rev_8_21_14_0_20_49_13]